MPFTLTPASLPNGYGEAILPLATVKAHLRVDSDDEDSVIARYRDAAIDEVEEITCRALGDRDFVATFDGFYDWMPLPRGPIDSIVVTGVSYIDSDGASSAITDGQWRVGARGNLMPAAQQTWPTGALSASVSFSAGYADPADIPARLIEAAILMTGHLFRNREATSDRQKIEVPFGVEELCRSARIVFS